MRHLTHYYLMALLAEGREYNIIRRQQEEYRLPVPSEEDLEEIELSYLHDQPDTELKNSRSRIVIFWLEERKLRTYFKDPALFHKAQAILLQRPVRETLERLLLSDMELPLIRRTLAKKHQNLFSLGVLETYRHYFFNTNLFSTDSLASYLSQHYGERAYVDALYGDQRGVLWQLGFDDLEIDDDELLRLVFRQLGARCLLYRNQPNEPGLVKGLSTMARTMEQIWTSLRRFGTGDLEEAQKRLRQFTEKRYEEKKALYANLRQEEDDDLEDDLIDEELLFDEDADSEDEF